MFIYKFTHCPAPRRRHQQKGAGEYTSLWRVNAWGHCGTEVLLWSWLPSLLLAASTGLLPRPLPDGISLLLSLLGTWVVTCMESFCLTGFWFGSWVGSAHGKHQRRTDGGKLAPGPLPCKVSLLAPSFSLSSSKSALTTQSSLSSSPGSYFLFSSSQVSGVGELCWILC